MIATLVCGLLAGCGRFGFELLPAPASGSDRDASTDGGQSDAGEPTEYDFCPGVPDRNDDGTCACEAANGDADTDRSLNCIDACPFDPAKTSRGQCGCGVAEDDGDHDSTPDCVDKCPSDANKQAPGTCGCGVKEQDTDLDGIPDCVDTCSGSDVSAYVPDVSCGVGYCKQHNTASTCLSGIETRCAPGTALSATDVTCDGVDDDCDGQVDEDYAVASTSCGMGVCASTGMKTCVGGNELDSCVIGAPKSATDSNCDNIDDDCDGVEDDDYAGMTTMCGTGACIVMGELSCVAGKVVDSCTPPSSPGSKDTTCNNIDDDCDGKVDEDYVVTATMCGVGACLKTGSKTCVKGKEVDSCKAGTATATKDTTCNKVDDDCDGKIDEDYAVNATNCGVGYCVSTGQNTCVAGAVQNSCVAKAPRTTTDDAFTPGNGVDDDCDGKIDEDVPACNTAVQKYEAGQYTIAIPGNCHSLTVRLWGGGGASGQNAGISGSEGDGGPGGYATATALVSGTINLYVGTGGSSGCNAGGTNAGAATYNGGTGGSGAGSNGADGVVANGGAGAAPSSGYAGGRGYYGGGGGGQGKGGLGASGNGGGGGAASVLIVNGTRAAFAGGGGGGGGAQALTPLGTFAESGGVGGSGCAGAGSAPNANGGGGGGGGVCQGSTTQRGSGTAPAFSGDIPSGRASGAADNCAAGGAGYATIMFAP